MAQHSLSFLFRKRKVATFAVFLGLASSSSFAHSAYQAVSATPYDRQMFRIHPLLANTNNGRDSLSLPAVAEWMTKLRAVPYHYFGRWQTPAEVNYARAADCKGKAVALYTQMQRNGAQNLRIVIGKHHIYDSVTHAWLEWERPEGSYMLDPTFSETPVRTMDVDAMTYLPLYAYDGARKYRAANVRFGGPMTRVATGTNQHPYLPAVTQTPFSRAQIAGADSRQFVFAKTEYLSLRAPKGFRQTGTTLIMPNADRLISRHSISATTRQETAVNRRHFGSKHGARRHTRGLARRGHRVIQSPLKRLVAS